MAIKVSRIVGPDLATRNGCVRLFESMNKIPEKKIILDFSDVSSISRSFAHQYLKEKKLSTKIISEIQVPAIVHDMLVFVKNQPQTRKIESEYVRSQVIT
jgi:hypothetical protein